MKPRIAIPVPTSTDNAYNERSWVRYATAIERSGGEPVELRLDSPERELRALASSCQGVCLPGSPADVAPPRYGAERDPATSAPDQAREAVDALLLEDAYAHRKPVLGICFGVQSLNVWRGGTLVQDLTPVPVNHSAGSSVAVAHAALISGNSLLAETLRSSEDLTPDPGMAGFWRLPINTSHHQSVAAPGDGLRISARCPEDGVIEAVESTPDGETPWVIGVQWHPERSYDISAASRALFHALLRQAAGGS